MEMLKKILAKLGFGAFYAFFVYIADYVIYGAFLNPWLGVLVGLGIACVASYWFRFNRGELRREYVKTVSDREPFLSEVRYLLRFDEFWIELALALASNLILYISSAGELEGTAGEVAVIVAVNIIINMVIFVLADFFIWVLVHKKWRDERITRAETSDRA